MIKKLVFSSLVLVMAVPLFGMKESHMKDSDMKDSVRKSIVNTMKDHIDSHSQDGLYSHFDPITGKLLSLKFKKLHKGIAKKGDFYVSCADFTDAKGTKVDLDFMVRNKGYYYYVNQALVHKIGKKTRPYHIEMKMKKHMKKHMHKEMKKKYSY